MSKTEIRKPDGIDEHQLVVCVDGPRAGAWYFEDHGSLSWNAQYANAAADTTPGCTFVGYVESGEFVKHPRWPEVTGKALVWRPERREEG